MKIRKIIYLLVAVAFLVPQQASDRELSRSAGVESAIVESPIEYDLLPVADAGRDFVTYVGSPTEFRGYGAAPADEIVHYEWDFDGDGAYDYQSLKTGITLFVYHSAGTYNASLRIQDAHGNVATDTTKVIVKMGTGKQVYLPAVRVKPVRIPSMHAQGDGVIERYAVMINGGYETRFWNDVVFMYSTLVDDYMFQPERIYLFNYEGTDPDGLNPDNMIDYPARLSDIDAVFADLAAIIDGDDELFVWVTDHGRGYYGPQRQAHGYLDGFASVDPGDEQDYLERDFKLRSLCTGGDYALPYFNHGMNVFKVYRAYDSSQSAYRMYRNKYVSAFANVYFENGGIKSDGDVYIERLVDYLLGDTDRDGYVETSQGEVFDYDGDGTPPYEDATGIFDEDDWGDLDYYEDNFNNINSGFPGESYMIFDHNFDNHLDIDINYDPSNLKVDGTDLDNQGLFDGIDVNEDGDMDDWVSIDEKICLPGGDMPDDELAILLDRIDAHVISVFMEQCFSGGFIDDLSGSNRVISTATEEESVSWGNLFVELFTTALHRATRSGSPVDVDFDHNGHISMREAFNYAAENDFFDEIPQYDDNGDGIGHPYPIPQGGDGTLGGITYLESFFRLTLMPVTDTQSGDPGTAVTYTLQVTNTGNASDTFNVTVSGYTWPTTAPVTVGPLWAGASANLDVIVDIPTDAAINATDTANIIVASQGDDTQSVTATLTTTANTAYGVIVEPVTGAQSGDLGETVTYILQVTNTGNTTDTFDVTASGYTWPTTAPAMVGPLRAGASANVDVNVDIPVGAAGGAADIAFITATSQGNNAKSTTVALTTTATAVYGVTVEPVTGEQSGDPGRTVTYTLQVTNTGNTTDTFDVNVSGYTWPTTAPVMVGPLRAGASANVGVIVDIPEGTAGGAIDAATIIFTSQNDDTQSVTAVLISVAATLLFLPFILK